MAIWKSSRNLMILMIHTIATFVKKFSNHHKIIVFLDFINLFSVHNAK